MKDNKISYYDDFISPKLKSYLLLSTRPVKNVDKLQMIGTPQGLETSESLQFLCDLMDSVKEDLRTVLNQRMKDRKFIDERTKSLRSYNKDFKKDYLSPDYKTIFGMEDSEGRIILGPKQSDYAKSGGTPIADIPEFLQGNHVTLFGPPDSAKLSINAMNAYHRKLKDEPEIVAELLSTHESLPKWGADDEDSKTPLHEDLVEAGMNLTKCLDGELSVEENGKKYELQSDKLSLPIKRFPGLALPSTFMFYEGEPVPLHLYDFALHFFKNWNNPKALAFYVPKLENEEEARYLRKVMESAESLLIKLHPSYKMGSIRLMIVLENPRAVFRVHEIMDELYPYFVGASLGWHDFLASTARLFKEDENYRIPVKADPDIVIKYIKASHDLLSEVVGPRGGIKVGGMYGILPTTTDLRTPSYQVTMRGYIRDVITQLKRNLSGFWVAHPDFVRLGLALLEAWKIHKSGDSSKLEILVKSLLDEKYHQEILNFIHGPDINGLEKDDPLYSRRLIVADLKESDFIANNHPEEIRYNVFQSLQYLTDWLSGNGCVALPALIDNTPVRVMDDLATAERSRWEVWHEIHHGRFSLQEFLKIAHEEFLFIRKDKSDDKKIVQVKWDHRTEKWYPVAFNLMIKLMTDDKPAEFATELLLPFTVESIRNSENPWEEILKIDNEKYSLKDYTKRFNYFFEICGSVKFASKMAKQIAVDEAVAKATLLTFSKQDIIDAASFHGNIGENKQTLDKMASSEQSKVLSDDEDFRRELRLWGEKYLEKFQMKFLVSAANKTGKELLHILKERINNSEEKELENAKNALWEITWKRMQAHPLNHLFNKLQNVFSKHGIHDAQVTIMTSSHDHQTLTFGNVNPKTWFEMASLSKPVASAFAIEYFKKKKISLNTLVSELLPELNLPQVRISHLMSHSALNLHYVNGVPANKKMPPIQNFLNGNEEYGYLPVEVINQPGEKFQYSGGGFLVLEYLIQKLERASIPDLTRAFLDSLEMEDWSFEQATLEGKTYANGYKDDDEMVEGTRKMFPSFAAGAMGTSHAMAHFLEHLEEAYHHLEGSGGLSHDTARFMLQGFDKGCKKFMNSLMGLGIFTIEAGNNKFMLHQGANDGFRSLFLHCYQGPDRGKGLVTLCNGDLKGVLFNAELAQEILKELKISGIDFSKFKSNFDFKNLKAEEVVNLGYKNLLLDAFIPLRPEPIVDKGPLDSLAPFNLCVDGEILEVSNELFARAENLLSPHLPKFDPELFGSQGKIMDSWESVRHNQSGVDYLIFKLKKPSRLKFVLLSTKYHTGNFAPEVKLEGRMNGDWIEILPRTKLNGHSELRITLPSETETISEVKVSQYPDGGLTRLGLYLNLPEGIEKTFDGILKRYEDDVPQTVKPLNVKFELPDQEIQKNVETLNGEINLASAALGAKILSATDEHYSPASQILSPLEPINMFDGMESARSRIPDHFEEAIIRLAKPGNIHKVDFDFTYFVNNGPMEISIDGLFNGEWVQIIPRSHVKPFQGGQKRFEVDVQETFQDIRLRTYPCGGLNRIKIYSYLR